MKSTFCQAKPMLIAVALVAAIGVTDRVQAWAVSEHQSTILPMQLERPTAKEAGVQENIRFSLDTTDWVLDYEYEVPGLYLAEFVRTGQTVENWQELITIQNFIWHAQSNSVGTVFDELKQAREEECPGQTTWTIIQQDETSLLYENRSMPCLGWPEQHEIGRFLTGENNLFRISYTAKVETLLPEVRSFWIESFSAAEIYNQ
jgi:hypothetical protein